MKSVVAVLIDPDVEELYAELSRVLDRHRLDEDDPESIRAHHWDYWYLPGEGTVEDEQITRDFPEENREVRENAAYVRNLPGAYSVSAIISEELGWIDLQDFGWKLVREPCRANKRALKDWNIRMREILSGNPDRICIEVIVHC